MRGPKMAELKFEAPLAKFDTDEWLDFEDHQGSEEVNNLNRRQVRSVQGSTDNLLSDNFSETVSDSLEDLVSSFDEKITKCFKNYAEKTDKIAPVQIRTQEEIMNDCQMWWTITGNFGNILPIDWSKSYARQLHMPSLNLFGRKDSDHDNLDMSDDEELAQAFDMHSLIVSSTNQEPVVSADDVIDEIDEIMQECPSGSEPCSPIDCEKPSPFLIKDIEQFLEKLQSLSTNQLTELYDGMECTIKEYSETLISELALRDELEYEKELKNSFISLLLSIQNKWRMLQMDKKQKNRKNGDNKKDEAGSYLTTVIPYHAGMVPPDIPTLQILIKVLQAINDDSATVPTLLTDYILNVLCPKSGL